MHNPLGLSFALFFLLASANAHASETAYTPKAVTRILAIGDSHSCGFYGRELDRLLRTTDSPVDSYCAGGSVPSWWVLGRIASMGFVARLADGSVKRLHRRGRSTVPKLKNLILRSNPHLLIVSLGANMRGLSPAAVRKQAGLIIDVAQQFNVRLVWVGPPKQRVDILTARGSERFHAFNYMLEDAMSPGAKFINSGQFTRAYAGHDGVHFSGARGKEIAHNWARGVFAALCTHTIVCTND